MLKHSSVSSTTIVSSIRRLSLVALTIGCLGGTAQAQTAAITSKPTIEEDRVTVRVKVTNDKGKPVMELQPEDFKLTVDSQPVAFDPVEDWLNPEAAVPPPAWIVVLLDFSGSMKAVDSKGQSKLEGAINAIREFTKTLADRGPNTQVAIVPFGEAGPKCEGFPVTKETIDRFFPASDFKLQNYLDFLAGQTACASTDLYSPVQKTVQFLGDRQDARFHVPKDSNEPEPRLSVILLSDGYHTGTEEEKDFTALSTQLGRNKDIIVHTLGYGLTPQQLGNKYKLGRPATRKDLKDAGSGKNRKVSPEEFVDEKRLADIANLTGGIHEMSGDATAIGESLKTFLDSLLGEYQITYTDPRAERGSKHEVSVGVNLEGQAVESLPQPYAITVFGRSLPLTARLGMLALVLVAIGAGGIVPFYLWAKSLKQREMQEG
jgi:von Willebrand factor type A domain